MYKFYVICRKSVAHSPYTWQANTFVDNGDGTANYCGERWYMHVENDEALFRGVSTMCYRDFDLLMDFAEALPSIRMPISTIEQLASAAVGEAGSYRQTHWLKKVLVDKSRNPSAKNEFAEYFTSLWNDIYIHPITEFTAVAAKFYNFEARDEEVDVDEEVDADEEMSVSEEVLELERKVAALTDKDGYIKGISLALVEELAASGLVCEDDFIGGGHENTIACLVEFMKSVPEAKAHGHFGAWDGDTNSRRIYLDGIEYRGTVTQKMMRDFTGWLGKATIFELKEDYLYCKYSCDILSYFCTYYNDLEDTLIVGMVSRRRMREDPAYAAVTYDAERLLWSKNDAEKDALLEGAISTIDTTSRIGELSADTLERLVEWGFVHVNECLGWYGYATVGDAIRFMRANPGTKALLMRYGNKLYIHGLTFNGHVSFEMERAFSELFRAFDFFEAKDSFLYCFTE